jgi:hypothetical protein
MSTVDKRHTPFALLSAEKAGAENNVFRSLELRSLLTEADFKFKPVKGFYKGEPEDSFYIELDGLDDIESIKTLARYFDQESVLFVNAYRTAILWNKESNQTKRLGKFTQVSEFIATTEDSYTYDIVNNGYYICK